MIKYYETLTNKRGDALPGYRAQVVDQAGATVPIYRDKSGTPFTVGGVTVNYCTADDEGLIEFYWTPAVGQVLQNLDIAGSLIKSLPDFADVAASQGSFRQSGTGAVARTAQAKMRDIVSIKDFGAVGDGVADDTAAIQALFNSGRKLIVIPEADYLTRSPIDLPEGVLILASPRARFIPGTAGMTMFRSQVNCWGTQWWGGKFANVGALANVTAFDLTGFRHAAEIDLVWFEGIETCIWARSLCWDTAFRHNFMTNVGTGYVVDAGSNAITIDHPAISGFTNRGIILYPGTGPLPTVGNNISNGYIQGGPVGIDDRTRATSIDGTYFEACTIADIHWNGATMPLIQRSYHSADAGPVCLKATTTAGGRVNHLVLEGTRTTGMFDFDATNNYCRADPPRTATGNTGLGIVTGLHFERRLGGTQEAGDVGWDGTRGIYGILGTGPGSLIERSIANGFNDIVDPADSAINLLQKADCYYRVVVGGEAFTFTNPAPGQSFKMLLKMSGALTTAITIGGVAIDMTGVADGKRKLVDAIYNNLDGTGTYYLNEGLWK